MSLLVLIALAMLSLSTIELRSSRLGNAEQEAKANARLSLMLALGQLQKAAGPDQRITASGNLIDAQISRGVTGVWESYPLDPTNLPDLASAKQRSHSDQANNGEHIQWLTSASPGNPISTTPPSGENNDQRSPLLVLDTNQKSLSARTITFPRNGGGAWATIDEGLKTRFNLTKIEPKTDELILARLRSPEKHGVETINALAGFEYSSMETNRMATLAQGELLAADKKLLASRFHDLTTWSTGLHTNVVDGGLKGDLSLAFEQTTLPPELLSRRVYSNNDTPRVPSDPYFSALADYYRLSKTQNKPGQPLSISVPKDYTPTTKDSLGNTVPNPQAHSGQVLAPVVSRVNIVFSLVGREAHGNWRRTIPNRSSDPNRRYMVYLIYTPVVTLYNPYTQPITVDSLKTSFRYLPLAFKFYRSNKAQNKNHVLLSQMHISSQNRTDWEDSFSCTLSDTAASSSSGSFELKPGEARVFGVSHKAGTRWGSMTNYLWRNDLHLSKTLSMNAGSGFNYNSGFIVDWLAPTGPGRETDNKNLGVFGVRGDDTIDVSFTPKIPTRNGNPMESFGVSITANVAGKATEIGSYQYKYGTRDRLIKAMEGGSHPTLGKVNFPVRREKAWNFNELYQTNVESTPVEKWTGPKQFAIFTLASRTSKDSLYPTQAGKHASFVQPILDMDITKAHPAQMPMELSFLPIKGQGANTVGSIDVFSATDPRSFFYAGWSAQDGFLHHPVYQIPRAPLTNIAELRHANLASSGHLPTPTYTVGESFAHPLLPADQVIDRSSHLGYATPDHAWLANNTLWDRYYFSGLRTATGIQNFIASSDLPLKPRQIRHLPRGTTISEAQQNLEGDQGWTSAAAYQLQKGSFNVNSTSIEAWISLLSSLHKKLIPLLHPTKLTSSTATSEYSAFPRIYDSPSGSILNPRAASSQERWTGFRDLDEHEIESLAKAIVDEIRKEGPFLSLSEFINRNPRGDADKTGRAGLLERAIQTARINAKSNTLNSRSVGAQQAKDFEYPNPDAALGDTEEASSAFLSQADILSVIGSSLTVRSDTFRIRAHGESRDANGRILAKATCEAIVQRIPDYVDPHDSADTNPTLTALNQINQTFGRRFKIIAFRWVRPEDN